MHGIEQKRIAEYPEAAAREVARALFSSCGNPRCATGWLRLWRSRRAPRFEGRWACSPECMGDMVAAAVRREMDRGGLGAHAHRLPMGLVLVEQGRITPEQLKKALADQREAGGDGGTPLRLGDWLRESGVLDEAALTRALSAQWNCPVLPLDGLNPEETAAALPRFLAEAAGVLPVRLAAGKLLYLAFAGGIDRGVCAAVEAMTGLKVVAGVAQESEFRIAHREYLEAPAPRSHFLEAGNSWLLARALTRRIEGERPVDARLCRVHGWFWLRTWRRAPSGMPLAGEVEDFIGSVGATP
jgi:hypothetical protein